MITPVFGTSCPAARPLGRHPARACAKLSEGQSAHWLLLVLGDRIDVIESNLLGLVTGRPGNFIAEMGLKAELTRGGLRSRVGRDRNDLEHLPIDVLMSAGKLAMASGIAFGIAALVRSKKKRTVWSRLLG